VIPAKYLHQHGILNYLASDCIYVSDKTHRCRGRCIKEEHFGDRWMRPTSLRPSRTSSLELQTAGLVIQLFQTVAKSTIWLCFRNPPTYLLTSV